MKKCLKTCGVLKMCDLFQLLCVYLSITTVALAVNRHVVRIQANNEVNEKNADASEEVNGDKTSEKEGGGANASYEYGYNVNDPLSNDVKSHHEIRDGEYVYGYYTFKEADGSTRVVNYKVGPQTGFQATVERLQLEEQATVQLPKKDPPPQPPDEPESVPTESSSRGIIRGRARGRNQQFDLPRNQYVEPPSRSSSYDRGYRQDRRPVRGRPRARSENIALTPHHGAGQTHPTYQNSLLGRKHIQRQIAILAEKKRQEEAAKAAQAAKEAQEAKEAEEAQAQAQAVQKADNGGRYEVRHEEKKVEEVKEKQETEEEGDEEDEDEEDSEEDVDDYEAEIDRNLEEVARSTKRE